MDVYYAAGELMLSAGSCKSQKHVVNHTHCQDHEEDHHPSQVPEHLQGAPPLLLFVWNEPLPVDLLPIPHNCLGTPYDRNPEIMLLVLDGNLHTLDSGNNFLRPAIVVEDDEIGK
jgi:hypothetical protein